MNISLAHLRIQSVDVIVFNADARERTRLARERLLTDLTAQARRSGLRVQKSALAFQENGQLVFFGTPDLVAYLSGSPFFQWTHTINVNG
jgi:hypothetical protein